MKNTSEKFRQGVFQGFGTTIKSLEALNSSKCQNNVGKFVQEHAIWWLCVILSTAEQIFAIKMK